MGSVKKSIVFILHLFVVNFKTEFKLTMLRFKNTSAFINPYFLVMPAIGTAMNVYSKAAKSACALIHVSEIRAQKIIFTFFYL